MTYFTSYQPLFSDNDGYNFALSAPDMGQATLNLFHPIKKTQHP